MAPNQGIAEPGGAPHECSSSVFRQRLGGLRRQLMASDLRNTYYHKLLAQRLTEQAYDGPILRALVDTATMEIQKHLLINIIPANY